MPDGFKNTWEEKCSFVRELEEEARVEAPWCVRGLEHAATRL